MDAIANLIWLWLPLAAAVLFWPRHGVVARWQARGEQHERALYEDALKHILAWERRSKTATPESLGGALGLPPKKVLELITVMESKGLIAAEEGGFRLTAEGERLGLHVVRAHRLWERYLADDAGVPMEKLHSAAEKAEHRLSAENLDELEAHLGHPQRDPHGDPIPTREGQIADLYATCLTAWPTELPARIAHIEDEPDVIFQQIVAAGLKPGMTIRILERSQKRVVISDGESEIALAPAVASNIQVVDETREGDQHAGAKRLSDLLLGEVASVVELDSECRGFSRRRLMDLGLTPHAQVEVALENTFGDPRAFRVRGAMIALRDEQARNIWVRVVQSPPREAPAVDEPAFNEVQV